jgi:glucose/arabinose dehydrogenase
MKILNWTVLVPVTVAGCMLNPVFAQEEAITHQFEGEHGSYVAERVVSGLSSPFAIEMMPDGSALVSQRDIGLLTRVNFNSGDKIDISGTPDMHVFGSAGLDDIELHPDFANNGWIYVSYSEGEEIHSTIVLDRFKLKGNAVSERERVFTADAWSEAQYHQGGRIQFHDGYVYMAIGDRQHRERAQDRSNHTGSIVRLHDDGRVPDDNPFVDTEDERNPPRPEIWSYGHRNPQGLFVHPESGELWENEHGPRGGDELNLIEKGANYGWPEISFGLEYDGGPINKGITMADGMEQPKWVYVPSIAPSDLIVYQGDAFPAWKGSLLTGSLAKVHLNRLTLMDGRVVNEERLANAILGRIRSLAVDDQGWIYLGTDGGDIWRLKPDR